MNSDDMNHKISSPVEEEVVLSPVKEEVVHSPMKEKVVPKSKRVITPRAPSTRGIQRCRLHAHSRLDRGK